ncbi:hypothetical protein LCGC14_3155620, partial [marine sediment metagenome]
GMTDQEKYIEGQKASGIEVGDTVRVVRTWEWNERGSDCSPVNIVGRTAVVQRLGCAEIETEGFYAPYFVLEIVKKANGTVPDAKHIDKGDSNMKNSRFDIEIVKEKTDDKHKIINGIVVKRYSKWHRDGNAATEYAKMKHGLAILEQEEAGFEVEILVHPFCG